MAYVKKWQGLDEVCRCLTAAGYSREHARTDITQAVADRAIEILAQLSLTLADLGGVGESIFHALPDMPRNFDTISARPGHERNLMVPYFAAHGGDGVAEGEDCFWIPSDGSRFELSRFGEVVCPERDDGEQSEQSRSGAKDRLVGPLALGFDAEMSAHFLEGDFDLPETDEPREYVTRMSVEIGCQECLRIEFAF